MQQIASFWRLVLSNGRDVLAEMLAGLGFVLVGLTLFVRGLSLSLFAVGEDLAQAMARRGNVAMLLGFAFAFGFGSTIAEPALHSVVVKVADAAGVDATR